MIRSQLDALVAESGRRLTDDPRALLANLEPNDPVDAVLADHLEFFVTADHELPKIIGTWRRDRLIRWDTTTTTWSASDIHTGVAAQIRVARPSASSAERDQLVALAPELGDICDGVSTVDGPFPAIVAHLPGVPLPPDPDDEPLHSVQLARLITTGLGDLERWDERGLCPPLLDPEELRDTGNGLAIRCLSPAPDSNDFGVIIGLIANRLRPWTLNIEGPIPDLINGLAAFPPYRPFEARHLVVSALGETLHAAFHRAHRRQDALLTRQRHERLYGLVARLSDAMPPPSGRAAVGVDLNGQVTRVEGNHGRLAWGAAEKLQVVYSPGIGMVPKEARKLLRAHAASPKNPRLQREIGGDAAFAPRACRWVQAAMDLRITRLFLEVS